MTAPVFVASGEYMHEGGHVLGVRADFESAVDVCRAHRDSSECSFCFYYVGAFDLSGGPVGDTVAVLRHE